MSIEAINWALNYAPIPTDKKNASSLAIVLLGLANHADSEGRYAFPAVKTLVRYTRLKERAVQYALRDLENLKLISPSDPNIIAAHIRRSDRRPNGWDLAIHTTNTPIHSPVHNPADEAHRMHPAPPDEVHTRPDGVHRMHPILPLTIQEPLPRASAGEATPRLRGQRRRGCRCVVSVMGAQPTQSARGWSG
jgi:hypothetical protein